MEPVPQRYSRQVLFDGIGREGQRRLSQARAAVVGLGALGTISATYLARAGVGEVRLIDRDVVELSNLQRQILYDERDAGSRLPKAAAAASHLRQVNSEIEISANVEDLSPGSIDRLLENVDLVLDGTDNFETRFLVNEWSVREEKPWIYGGAVGAYGLTLTVLPAETACLVCVFESAPPAGHSPTCETSGILGPVAGTIASLQAGEALKILAGQQQAVSRSLTMVDLWGGRIRQVALERRQDPPCPVCHDRVFPYLESRTDSGTVRLCGRNAVQVSPSRRGHVDLDALAIRLENTGNVVRNRFLVRVQVEGYDLTVFADGRSMVAGTDDPVVARSLVSRYVGA